MACKPVQELAHQLLKYIINFSWSFLNASVLISALIATIWQFVEIGQVMLVKLTGLNGA